VALVLAAPTRGRSLAPSSAESATITRPGRRAVQGSGFALVRPASNRDRVPRSFRVATTGAESRVIEMRGPTSRAQKRAYRGAATTQHAHHLTFSTPSHIHPHTPATSPSCLLMSMSSGNL
jgi:hypothetical protein